MSAERPWKIYLAAIAIICLLVGVGVGWVVKPAKAPEGWVPPEEYEAMEKEVTMYEYLTKYYEFVSSTTPSGMVSTLKEAETPWGSIWDMVSSGWPGVEEYDPDVEAQNVEIYKQWLTEILGKPPEEVTGTLVVAAWAGLGRENETWWNNGPWGFKNIFPNVEIQWKYFEDEPVLRAQLEMDPEWADIMEVCGSQWKLILDGYLSPIDPSLVPLLAEFAPEWLLHFSFWYDNQLYGVCFEYGQTSMAYRVDIFEELGIFDKYPQYFEDETLVDLAGFLCADIPELEGKIWVYDSVIEVLDLGIEYLTGAKGVTMPMYIEWTLDSEKFEAAKEAMYLVKPKIGKFFTGVEEAYGALQSGEAAAVIAWNDVFAAASLGPDWRPGTGDEVPVKWAVVHSDWGSAYTINSRLLETKGFDLWVAAHAFLNAVSAPEAHATKISEWLYGAPNRYAWDLAIQWWEEWGIEEAGEEGWGAVLEEILAEAGISDVHFMAVECVYWMEIPDEIVRPWEEFWLEYKA